MTQVGAKSLQDGLRAEGFVQEDDEGISFLSLVRKLSAFTVVILLFHLAVPLPEANLAITSGLGIEHAWYRDVPLTILVAGLNAGFAIVAFRLVR
ncbi:MAG: hypothetical protein QNJ67_16330 [Kiloniellales bacterium]|nr:hypothetical protein [Kiloniellales bacterium]